MGRKHRSSSFGGSSLPPPTTPTPPAAPPTDLTPCHTLVNHFIHGRDLDGRTFFHRAIEAASSSSFAGSPAPSPSMQDVNTKQNDKLDGLFFMDALSTRMKELDALSASPRGSNNGGNKQIIINSHFARMLTKSDTESGYNSLHYAILRRDLMTLLVLLKHASSSSVEDNGNINVQMLHPLRLLDGNFVGENEQTFHVINALASSFDHEQLTPLQLLGRTSSNGLEHCRRTLQWKSLRKIWKRSKSNSGQIQGNESVGQSEDPPRHRRRRMISFGDDRDYDMNYDIEEDPDRAALAARERRARSGSFNVDLNDGHHADDDEEEQFDGRNHDLMPLDDADFGVLADGDDPNDDAAASTTEQRPIPAHSNQAPVSDDYGCEVLTFGRADHCALGVPQYTTSARIRERGEDNFSSSSNTTSYKPKRVETFALGELRRGWSSSDPSASCVKRERDTVDSPAVAIAASTHHTLVSTQSGQLFSFGLGKGGRLGVGDENHRPLPTRVLGPLTKRIVASIAAAENHSLCSTSDGDVYAWGSNGFGQLGIVSSSRDQQDQGANVNNSRLSPRRVEGELKQSFVVAVAAGDRHSVALTRLGEVYCWGDNRSGQLGMFNSSTSSSTPLSPSQSNGRFHRPQRVDGLWSAQPRRRAIAISASEFSTLVLTMPLTVNAGESIASLPVNTIYGWGHGNHSPMRVGFPDDTSLSVSNQNSSSSAYARSVCINPIAIASAKYHSVAITACGRVYTWGLHSESLGIERSPGGGKRKNSADLTDSWATSGGKKPTNIQSSSISSPQLVVDMLPENGGGQAVAVSASESHTAVVTSDGHLYTFGSTHGNGVLGHKGVRWQPNPRKVKRVHRAVCVSAAKEHTVMLMGTSFPSLPCHHSSEMAVDSDGYHQPLSLQDSASIEISRNVDLFNVIPIALVAHRLNCQPLMNFCEVFMRKNLDGVLAVSNKNDISAFLSSRTLAGVTRSNECDGLFHPLLWNLANSKTWMEEGTMLMDKYSGSLPPKKPKRTKRTEPPSSIRKDNSSSNTIQKIVAEKETPGEHKSSEASAKEEIEEQVQVPKKLFQEKAKGKSSGNTPKFHCSVCGVSCPDNDSYTLHVNGRKHRNRLMHVKAEEEKAMAENIHSMKRMSLMEDSVRDQQMQEKLVARKQKDAWGAPKVATTTGANTTSSQRKSRSTSFHDILNEEQKKTSSHPGIARGSFSTPTSAKLPPPMGSMSPANIFPTKSSSIAYAKPSSTPSPGPSLTLSAFMKKKNEPKLDPMGSVGASWGTKPAKSHGVSWSAKKTNISLSKQQQTPSKMKSFSEIQQEEEAMRINEDHMCHIEGKWFVQQRERAASIGEIQQKEKEEREMQELIEEQKQIEIEIMKQLKQENDAKKKDAKNNQGRKNQKPKNKPGNDNSKKKHPSGKSNNKLDSGNSKKKNPQNGKPKKNGARPKKEE